MTCPGFTHLMTWQAGQMQEAIKEDKWFLSQQAGHDVGETVAEKDFTENHLTRCACDWRKTFCGALCEHRTDCDLGQAMIAAGLGKTMGIEETTLRRIIREELGTAETYAQETATAKVCGDLFGLRSYQLKKLWLDGQIRGRKLGEGRSAAMLYNINDIRDFINYRHKTEGAAA